MPLGPYPFHVPRIAGDRNSAAWGQATAVVKVGETLPKTQLVRASVGYPAAWAWAVYFDGNLGGIGGGGVATVAIQPGMGRGGSPLGIIMTVKPGDPPATAPASGTPATELLIEVVCNDVATVEYTLVAVASPIFYVPNLPRTGHWGPQG